jgi:integrase
MKRLLPGQLPPNTRILRTATGREYIQFRKGYEGRTITKTWPNADGIREQAFADILGILSQMMNRTYKVEEKDHRITVKDFLSLYWDRHASKLDSAVCYKSYLGRATEFLGHMWLDEIKHPHVQKYKDWLQTNDFGWQYAHKRVVRKLGVSAVNKHMMALIAAFNWLREQVELEELNPVPLLPKQTNPAALVGKDNEEDLTRTRVLSQEEFERLLAVATPRAANIYRIAIFTFLRLKDLKALSGVNQEVLKGIQAKTSRGFKIYLGDFAFMKPDFTNWSVEFKRACKLANIKDVQFRDLRRTGATWLFRQTNDLGMVQHRLGHASSVMTKKYLGIMDDDDKRASSVLGGILAKLDSGPKLAKIWLKGEAPEMGPLPKSVDSQG